MLWLETCPPLCPSSSPLALPMCLSHSAGGAQGLLKCGEEGVESFVRSPLSGVSKKVSDTELGVARATWAWVTGGPRRLPVISWLL